MYNFEDRKQIDIAEEIAAMVEFIQARWTNVENIGELMHTLAQVAQASSQGAILAQGLSPYLYDKARQRKAVIKEISEAPDLLKFYDQLLQFFEQLDLPALTLERHGRDRLHDGYEAARTAFKEALKQEHLAHLKKAKPAGLAKILKHYQAEDDVWDKVLRDEFSDKHLFKGANTDNNGSASFVYRVSMVYVVQTKVTHNESPFKMLLPAIYNHLVEVYKHNNTQAIIEDLEQVAPLVAVKKPVFKLDFSPKHALTKALLALAHASEPAESPETVEKEYLEALAERKAKKPLSPEEAQANRAKALAVLQTMVRSKGKGDSKKAAKEQEARDARDRRIIQDSLANAS